MIEQESFDRALRLIGDLTEKRQLVVALKPPFAVTFEVREEALAPALEEADITQAAFREASSEIGDMVLATLSGADDVYIRREAAGIDEAKRGEVEDQLKQRLEATRVLIDDRLRARYQLKVSSKAPALASVDWDVKIKTFDARLGPLRLPYATLKIRWQREFEMEAETFFGRNLFDSVQINLTREEVEYFVRELQAIRDRLEVDERS